MKSDRFQCPCCSNQLQKEVNPPTVATARHTIVWCGNPRCPSDVSNNGGTGPTEEAAYRALLLSVKHEEDRETERECEPLTAEDLKDRNEWAKAERKNDQRGCL